MENRIQNTEYRRQNRYKVKGARFEEKQKSGVRRKPVRSRE